MSFTKITESESNHNNLEKMSVEQLSLIINEEDQTVANAVKKTLPQINSFIDTTLPKMQQGGRLFYIGAGTSGRLGILDASECPPTFGVSQDHVIGLIAGGDGAIQTGVEGAEDDSEQGWKDLENLRVSTLDTVVGIAASGTTPYVVGAIQACKSKGITTAAISCNPGSPIAKQADYPMVPVVGPEVITGSSRMKAGTAQKMILNTISSVLMIKLGHVKGNRMVDMQLSNQKLHHRAIRMVCESSPVSEEKAIELLRIHGSVRKVLNHLKNE
jgi:N-acetylmuramic acid 6-phosphate etherase